MDGKPQTEKSSRGTCLSSLSAPTGIQTNSGQPVCYLTYNFIDRKSGRFISSWFVVRLKWLKICTKTLLPLTDCAKNKLGACADGVFRHLVSAPLLYEVKVFYCRFCARFLYNCRQYKHFWLSDRRRHVCFYVLSN